MPPEPIPPRGYSQLGEDPAAADRRRQQAIKILATALPVIADSIATILDNVRRAAADRRGG